MILVGMIWLIAMGTVGYMVEYHIVPVYNGPPIEIDIGGFNPRGDRRFLQGASHYNPNAEMAGLHLVVVWSEYSHRLELCEDVFHNYYANEHDARLGILMDPARYSQVHPKMGRRGCWHMLGLL